MKPKVTCYSGGEGRFMEWSQQCRAKLLGPMLARCAEAGLHANHITLSSLLAGLAFVPAVMFGLPGLALAMLALHVMLDGLDGPLARFRGQASNRGSFTDTMADQLVVTASTLAMVQSGHAAAWPGGLYVFLYALVVGFALVRNALNEPYSWLFRPRFVIFGWFAVEFYFLPGSLDTALWIASAALGIKAITGFIRIRRRM
ncbi:hypothetical protein HAHE_08630 [Haloferula helveola]|uniref:CDP-alcohol phosphatidyltransferase family protein n=1 Tax=Haloferula helveola TaxID=490095 RepID=A0ABM7R7V8_9BACT|nr:hypothetical protein HAHE_08630 [Haloferula helveola]